MLTIGDREVKVLHIEPTDACNAACPQCLRETDKTFNKDDLHHLTVDQIKQLISEDTISNLNKVYMCGDYGDPAAGRHTLDIFRYFRSINPSVVLGMNTNGGLRSVEWWRELAEIMHQPTAHPQEYVVWSIDGLEDTNHIYRVNVNWNKVIENAKAFIAAGGLAHWEMLVFEHNQHQVDMVQNLARDMGFKWFRAKVSKRFIPYPVEFLNPPSGWQDPVVTQGSIDCQAIKESTVYISARGILYPCCWLATEKDSELGNFSEVIHTWKSNNPHQICKTMCSSNSIGTSFTNQWQREVEF